MATFNFTAPDGTKYQVSGPDDATQEQAFEVLQQQIANGTAISQKPDTSEQTAQQIDNQLSSTLDTIRQKGKEGKLNSTDGTQPVQESYGYQVGGGLVDQPYSYSPAQKQVQDQNLMEGFEEQQIQKYLPQAKAAKERGEFKDLSEREAANKMYKADQAKLAAETAVTALTLPFTGAASGAGALINGLRMAGTAGLQSGAATLAGQAAESAVLDQNKFNTGDLALSTGLGVAGGAAGAGLGAGINAASKAGSKVASNVRALLPNASAEVRAKALAPRVSTDEVGRVLQNDDAAAQQVYKEAVGTRIPSQTYRQDGILNKTLKNIESTAASRPNSVIAKAADEQVSGNTIRNASDNLNSTRPNIQESSNEVVDAIKAQNKLNYKTELNDLQDAANTANIKSFKLPESRKLAMSHVDADNAVGKVNLTTDARRTLNQFNQSKIPDIKTADKWKRTLNEKANKAYRAGDYEASNALKSVSNSLQTEIDSTLRSFDPNLSAGWKRADEYYKNSIGDFGDRSVLGKIASKENPDVAGNALVRGTNARYNAEQVTDAIGKQINDGIQPQQARNFAEALGSEARNAALPKYGSDFKPKAYAQRLDALDRQSQYASDLATKAGSTSPLTESAANRALADAARTISNQPKADEGVISNILNGNLLNIVNPKALAVDSVKELATRALNRPLSNIMQREANFLSDPANAKLVQRELDRRALAPSTLTSDMALGSRAGYLGNRVAGDQLLDSTEGGGYVPPSTADSVKPVSTEEVQPKGKSGDSGYISKSNEALYNGIVHAETGGISNPWVRTGAPDKQAGGVSTAWGEAQITGTLMRDMLSRYPDMFTPEEKEYGQLFLDQADLMRDNPDDGVFGYGKAGVLGSNEKWRQTYRDMARKIIEVLYKESGSDYDTFIKRWRGLDDPSYASRVDNGVSDYLERNA